MAKSRNMENTTEDAAAETSATVDTGKRVITIQGIVFSVQNKYAAGHVLTQNEAGALNQTLAENLRNNFASSIKEYREEKAKAAGLEPDAYELSADDMDGIRAQFDEYAAGYEFGVRSGRLSDPIDIEAKALATAKLDALLSANGISKKDYKAAGKYDAKLAELMERSDVRQLAAKQVADRAAILKDLGPL